MTTTSIAQSNYDAAKDLEESYRGECYTSFAAYLVNAIDTAREHKLSAEWVAQKYLDLLKESE